MYSQGFRILDVAFRIAILLLASVGWIASPFSQDIEGSKPDNPKIEPKYDQTFSGTIVELSDSKLTVARSILGKPPENRTFAIQPDTRIEGKLRVKLKVTVGYITTSDGDIARLIVARPQRTQKK